MELILFLTAAVIGILPALLVFFAGQALAYDPDEQLHPQKWALFWLYSASMLILPYAIFASHLLTQGVGLVWLLAAPTLWCALGMLILNARSLSPLWRSRRAPTTALLLWLLTALVILALRNGYIALYVIVPCLTVALLWGAGRRLAALVSGYTNIILGPLTRRG